MRKLFNPEIFLDIAKKIKENRDLDEQGKFRTVIGRAYYAAFLTTREHLKSHKARNETDQIYDKRHGRKEFNNF